MAEFLSQYQLLYNKARTDFNAAQVLFFSFNQGDSELDLEVIYFHLQQCAEKCFKSILSYHQINFPKVHDLEVLVNLLRPLKVNLQVDTELLIELSDFAVEGRYNVIHDDLNQAQLYFKEVESLLSLVSKLIS